MNFTRRKVLGAVGATALSAAIPVRRARAQQNVVKIGMSMPQTGSLGAGGKAELVAIRMWVDDVNKKGGLLGRKVEFIVYDDQTNPALTPGIYTKLLDVDKVDLLIAPYGTVPTAPIMPLVKQRGLLLIVRRSAPQDSGDRRPFRRVQGRALHDLLLNHLDRIAWRDAEQAVDRIAGRFGPDSVRPAVLVQPGEEAGQQAPAGPDRSPAP